jgi:hypothetical protein
MLVLPVILGLVVGLVDLTTVLQGYNALREGVRQSVRCVATTDGRCSAGVGAAPLPLFDWYRLGGAPTYFVDRFDLRGNGYYLERLRRTYTEALVLGAAQLTVPTTDFAAKRWVHPATVRTRYNVRETTGAYLTGTNPRSPNFRYAGAPGTDYDAQHIFSHQVEEVLDLNRRSVSIDVPFDYPLSNAPCYRSTEIDEAPGVAHSPDEATCSRTRIPALIFVRGAARGTGNGKLDLRIDGVHIGNSDFGGQTFSASTNDWASRNFIPRGVASGFFVPELAGAPELSEYADRIKLRPGEVVRVTVSIPDEPGSWNGSNLAYRITEVRIIPAIIRSIDESVACPNGVPRSQHLNGTPVCGLGYPSGALGAVTVDAAVNLDSSPPLILAAQVAEAQAMSTLGGLASPVADFIVTPLGSGSGVRSVTCPPNPGVVAPANAAGLVDHPSAAAVCPPTDPVLAQYGVVPTSVMWTEVRQLLPVAAQYSFSPGTCGENETPPGALLAYPKRIGVTTTESYFPGDGATPLDPAFGCPEFNLRHVVFDDPARGGTVALPNESRFIGTHGEGDAACLTNTLKNDAVTYGGLDPRAHFVAESRRVDTVSQVEPPAESCAVYTTQLGTPDQKTLVTGGAPLPLGSTPPECVAHPCVAEFARLGSEGTADTPFDPAAAAAQWGFSELSALYPRARLGCSTAECVELAVDSTGDAVTGRGQLTVPLRALFGREMTLTFAETRVKETSLQR